MKDENELEKLFVSGLYNEVFSGASLGVAEWKNGTFQRLIQNYGYTQLDGCGTRINNDTFYDLASLTKPLVTVLSLLHLVDNKKTALDCPVSSFFSQLKEAKLDDIQLSHLLSHSSGLPAHKEYFRVLPKVVKEEQKEYLLRCISGEKLLSLPGEKHLYSDLGFILLGYIIEKIAGESLDLFWEEKVCRPLGLEKKLFFHSQIKENKNIAITGRCPVTGEWLKGIVHDDNCRSLGGVCGHAGLFGTIEGVLSLCEILLATINNLQHPRKIATTHLHQWIQRIPKSSWCLGFDMPTKYGSSSGKYFSMKSIGHLGFTGVSFWIDIERQIIIVLLTNRTIMGPDNTAIKKFRPKCHNIVRELIEKEDLF